MFEKKMIAGWGDMDFNSHMRNTAYLDKAGDVRMMFFAENGFPVAEFIRLKIGPVILKDELEYFKEVHLLEELTVNLTLLSLSEDGSRFTVRNEFFRSDALLAARVTSRGAWFDQTTRKIVTPPGELLAALKSMPATSDSQKQSKPLYMVVEQFKNGNAIAVFRRFRDQGRLAPEGLGYVSSWVDQKFERCYQVMETDNRELLDRWISRWNDLVDFEVVPVMTSREASERIADSL